MKNLEKKNYNKVSPPKNTLKVILEVVAADVSSAFSAFVLSFLHFSVHTFTLNVHKSEEIWEHLNYMH